MPSKVEKALSHKNRREGVLVPLLEDLLQKPLNVENNDDVGVIKGLLDKQVQRERERGENSFYSPSSLASCLRQVYFSRHHKELGIKKKVVTSQQAHYYFATGNFSHLKWQFALYKLNKSVSHDVFQLWGLEVPVVSKHGDHGGTLDALAYINRKLYVIDFKGVNVRTFAQAVVGEVQESYKIQISDYMMLVNADRKIKNVKVETGLIVYENKGGPDSKHPIALHEVEVRMKDHLPEIKSRLEALRENEKASTIPAAACQSIRETQFQSCPFRAYCKAEVQENTPKGSDSAKHRVAVPPKRRTRSTR